MNPEPGNAGVHGNEQLERLFVGHLERLYVGLRLEMLRVVWCAVYWSRPLRLIGSHGGEEYIAVNTVLDSNTGMSMPRAHGRVHSVPALPHC